MKKIFTFLFAVGMVSIASAQSRGFDNHRNDNGYAFNKTSFEVQKINREYDYKIAAVKVDRHLSRREKERQIRYLETQRMFETNRVQRFNKYDDRYNDRKLADNRRRW